MTSSEGDVIRLGGDKPARHQSVKASLTLNEVTVTLDEVNVVNASCVRLHWQLSGDGGVLQWLRVQYWVVSTVVSSSHTASPRNSVLVALSTRFILAGLEQNTRYGLCVQPVYKSGAVGKCSNTRHVYVTTQPNGNSKSSNLLK